MFLHPVFSHVRRSVIWFPLLLLFAAGALFHALLAGTLEVSPGELLRVLAGGGSPLERQLLLELRLPRALAAFATGGLLALAGALLQVLLRNPLADPYVLGVSGGAAVAALLGMLAGLSGWWFSASAFIGALASIVLVFVLARGRDGWNDTRLLLVGVVIATGWGAMITFILALAPDRELRGMLFWLMGDLSGARNPWFPLLLLGVGVVILLPLARGLNLLARGELQAAALGLEVARFRVFVYLAASLFTAVAVTLAGGIGFIGLLVPHLVRLILGSDHRFLLPAVVLFGGGLLVVADTLARTLIAPQQLPVGALTAMLGVPFFLYLLHRSR